VILSADAPVPDLVRPVPSTYADVQGLIQRMQGGQVQALLVYGANPLYELPDKAGFRDALGKVPFVATFRPTA